MKQFDLKKRFKILLATLKEVFISSLPLAAIIIIVCGFIDPLDSFSEYVKLIVGCSFYFCNSNCTI